MKFFLVKLVLFIFVPVIGWGIIEALLPITFFTHRHSEAIRFKSMVPSNTDSYPNITSSMNAVGDLCHHTENQIIKYEVWKTDKFGFRNNKFIEEADILFIGDSFIEGTSLSQEETISNRLGIKFKNKIKVYNMAPSSMSQFDKYLKLGIIKKPKLLIFSIVERDVPNVINSYKLKNNNLVKNSILKYFQFSNINMYIDKALKLYSIEWFRARIHGLHGNGVPGTENSRMFFLNGIKQKNTYSDLKTTSAVITCYKNYCDSLGIKFLFIPMPNKETVYWDLVPFSKQPKYLLELDSSLQNSNVLTVNSLKVYNDYRRNNRKILYHLDDSHWNSNAVELISDEIISKYSVFFH